MDEVVPSEEARRRLPAMLRALRQRGDDAVFVIGRHRRPEAVLIGVEEYERLRAAVAPAAQAAAEARPGLSPEVRETILRIAHRRGARGVKVFGSVARGDADPGSDLDLLVDLEPGYRLFDLGGLVAELEAALGRTVDVVPEDALRPELRERVRGEAVPL